MQSDDELVIKNLVDCTYYNGRPNRRSKIRYLLSIKSLLINELTKFVESDIEDLMTRFQELNAGIHGVVGKINTQQLLILKKRVEDSIQFFASIATS